MKKRMSTAKNFVAGMLVMALLSGTVVMAAPVVAELVFGVAIVVDGTEVTFDADSRPFITEGRTFVPAGVLARMFGYEVDWDGTTRTVSITTNTLDITVDNINVEPWPMPEVDPLDTAPPAGSPTPSAEINPITIAEITALQQAWGAGLVSIATAYAEGEDYVTVAAGVLDDLYGYAYGPVLFKPTIASEVPFRFTWEQAASYFIGSSVEAAGLEAYEEDGTGFATSPWTNVRFGTDGMHIINGETALWMGTVYITDATGEITSVQKSLGLFRDSEGAIRIQLHHSSVPFQS